MTETDAQRAERIESDRRARRLWITIAYCGPWERAMEWLWYLRPHQTSREVRPFGLRDRLAILAERRHMRWVDRHADHPERKIHPRWKRQRGA